MIADLTFGQELLIAALGGLLAAGGSGVAVYTQLGVTHQRREIRNETLNRFYDDARLSQYQVALALILAVEEMGPPGADTPAPREFPVIAQRAYALADEALRFGSEKVERVMRSLIQDGVSAAQHVRRCSAYDAWILGRLEPNRTLAAAGNNRELSTDTATSYHLSLELGASYLQRRLRTSNPLMRLIGYLHERWTTRRRRKRIRASITASYGTFAKTDSPRGALVAFDEALRREN